MNGLGAALDDLAHDLARVIDTVDDDAARFRLILVANSLRNLAAATEQPTRLRPAATVQPANAAVDLDLDLRPAG